MSKDAGVLPSSNTKLSEEAVRAVERARRNKLKLVRSTPGSSRSRTLLDCETLSEPKYAGDAHLKEVSDSWFVNEHDLDGASKKARSSHEGLLSASANTVSLYVSKGGKHVRSGAKRVGTLIVGGGGSTTSPPGNNSRTAKRKSMASSQRSDAIQEEAAEESGVLFHSSSFLESPSASAESLSIVPEDEATPSSASIADVSRINTRESGLGMSTGAGRALLHPAEPASATPSADEASAPQQADLRRSALSRVSTYQESNFSEPDRPSRTLTFDDGGDENGNHKLRGSKRSRAHKAASRAKSRVSTLRPKDVQRMLMSSLSSSKGHGKEAQKALEQAGLDRVDALLEAALIANGMAVEEKQVVAYDVLYEHQRGLVVFGSPKFSSSALFQLDPSAWTDDRFRNSPYTRQSHPLPNPYWHWSDPFWMVDMGGDTDEHGWSYAVNFGSKHWRGEASHWWRSFVRRRRWIRGRVYKPRSLLPAHLVKELERERLKKELSSSPSSGGRREDEAEVDRNPDKARRELIESLSSAEVSLDPRDPFVSWTSIKSADQGLSPLPSSGDGLAEDKDGLLWREAVVEINYRRVARIMRDVRLDRERLALWKRWLGVRREAGGGAHADREDEDEGESASPFPDEADEGGGRPRARPTLRESVRSSFMDEHRDNDQKPDASDVWDLIERRLDLVLRFFEYQTTRINLLKIVRDAHASSHAKHKYEGWDRESRLLPRVLDRLEKEEEKEERAQDGVVFHADLVSASKDCTE